MTDLIHRRYADPQFIFAMPADEGVRFLLFVMSREEEELLDSRLFARWIPYQAEISFEDFKEQLRPKKMKDDKEVLKDVESILKSWEGTNGTF